MCVRCKQQWATLPVDFGGKLVFELRRSAAAPFSEDPSASADVLCCSRSEQQMQLAQNTWPYIYVKAAADAKLRRSHDFFKERATVHPSESA